MRAALRDARAAGLRPVLFPIVRLLHPRTGEEWRGTLAPADRAAWFASYGGILDRLARLATEERAAGLFVGSELSTLDEDPAPWRALVRRVRRRFRGPLGYSANWDHYERVAIYPLVDRAGVAAYFPVDPPTAAGWARWRPALDAFIARVDRPVVLTEVGYRSVRGATHEPWNEGAVGEVDLEEQLRGYRAFREAFTGSPLGGVYFWNWYGFGGAGSRSYTPRAKPAAEEIRRYFARP